MKKLIQTKECSIIFDENNKEIFRCPRELDNMDLPKYINENRFLVRPFNSDIPFENDDTKDLGNVPGKKLIGYWRMCFRHGWYGSWFLEEDMNPSKIDIIGINEIIDWISDNFINGCDYYMSDYFKDNFNERAKNRYLIKPFMDEHYKVMVDTTYGNGDYPVRIYVYE